MLLCAVCVLICVVCVMCCVVRYHLYRDVLCVQHCVVL